MVCESNESGCYWMQFNVYKQDGLFVRLSPFQEQPVDQYFITQRDR